MQYTYLRLEKHILKQYYCYGRQFVCYNNNCSEGIVAVILKVNDNT